MTLPALPFEAKPVRRLHRPRREELWALDEPVLLTGCMEDWTLFQELRARASFEQKLALLGSLFGAQPVSFQCMPRGTGGHYHFAKSLEDVTFGQPTSNVPFDVFAQRLLRSLNGASDDYVYLQAHLIAKGTPLHQALGPNVLPLLSEEQARPLLWAGSNGQVVNLHYDDFLNFICMVEGTKRVTMFSPELLPSMYHAPFDRMLNMAQASHVRLLEVDHARFPRFREALSEARVAVVQPGEVLYIPPMWWHHVESFGLNVMVNNWVLVATLEELVETQENLTRAVRMFASCTEQQRAQALALYRRTVFAPATGAAEEGPGPGEAPQHARHRLETQRMLARMPDFLRRQMALYYEHFVFQVHGDPIPSQPGAFAAMLERNAHTTTFFLREE